MLSSSKKGTTLVEILIATLVFVIAFGSLLSSLIALIDLVDIAKDRSVATFHLKNMMERMRATPFDLLTARFPDGLTDGPVSNPYANIVGSYSLNNEAMMVSYADPNTDPLEIQAQILWQDKKGHSFTESISTFRTR